MMIMMICRIVSHFLNVSIQHTPTTTKAKQSRLYMIFAFVSLFDIFSIPKHSSVSVDREIPAENRNVTLRSHRAMFLGHSRLLTKVVFASKEPSASYWEAKIAFLKHAPMSPIKNT